MRLYAVVRRRKTQLTNAVPRWWSFRSCPMVFSHPKTSLQRGCRVPTDELLDLVMPAAGAGTRIGGVVPKHLLDLAGKPVFIHSLLVYERIPAIGRKIIVCQPDSAVATAEALKRHGITNWELTDGGATRQESVRRGLDRVATDRVVIHNAAVALVTCDLIQNVIGIHEDCVTTATPLELNVVRGAEYAEAPVDRRELKVLVPGSPQSFKITTPLDLVIAEALLRPPQAR
jgi:2-C-methyl-D-erythritol 4-phosphate cytidylyltransferase